MSIVFTANTVRPCKKLRGTPDNSIEKTLEVLKKFWDSTCTNIHRVFFLLYTVFSLNFCSAGKGPFIGGKAKKQKMCARSALSWGREVVEWGTWL